MSKLPQPPEREKPKSDAPLPLGQREGEGTNAVQHEPDPGADPLPDGGHKYTPRTGFNHGND
jgi:hypothetical protein